MLEITRSNVEKETDSSIENKVLNLTRHYAYFPTQTVWLKSNKDYYSDHLGVVAFEETARSFVVAGDPLCPNSADSIELFYKFRDWAHARGKSVCGYYFSEGFVTEIKGFVPFKAGVSRFLKLDDYDLAGYESRDARRAINHGRRANLKFLEISHEDKPLYKKKLQGLEQNWLKNKRLPRIKFLLSEISDSHLGAKEERWFVVSSDHESNIQAMVSVNTYFENDRAVAYIDHLLQFEEGHKFALDYLLARLIVELRESGYAILNLGFCPFQKINPSGFVGMGLWVSQWLEPIYASKGLYKYKRKFTDSETNRFLLIDNTYSSYSQLASLLKVTFRSD